MTGFMLFSSAVLLTHAATLCRWALGWRRAIRQGSPHAATPSEPVFAVVIPARNEAASLPHVLDDLAMQKDGPSFRVVVVDDHSVDDTSSVVQSHPLARAGRAAVVLNRDEGKKSALLTGINHVNAPWILALDADVRLGEHWARSWSRGLAAKGDDVACVAGPVVLSSRGTQVNWSERIQALDYAAQMGWSAGQLARNAPGSASGANLAFRPATYPDTRDLGPSGDDTLVVQALQAQGLAVAWLADSEARVWTRGATTVAEWVSQRLRWAGKAQHYPWGALRTALWMGLMAATQWLLVAGALVNVVHASWAIGWWVATTILNAAYASPVVAWFGIRAPFRDWVLLGFTQPFQVPLLLLARAGVLRPWGIASQPTWKGRTCSP